MLAGELMDQVLNHFWGVLVMVRAVSGKNFIKMLAGEIMNQVLDHFRGVPVVIKALRGKN